MPKMKCSLLLASVAALFLATGTAHAQAWPDDSRKEPEPVHADNDDQWVPDYRRGYVRKGDVVLTREDLFELQKFVVPFQKMAKFWQCVDERNEARRLAGRHEGGKHCYLPKGKLYGEDRILK
jgi:hypothetical protein